MRDITLNYQKRIVELSNLKNNQKLKKNIKWDFEGKH